jgi:hypothetical protein
MLKKPDADHKIYECGCHAPTLPLKCAYWPSFSSPLFLSPTHFSYPGPAFDSGGEGHTKPTSWITKSNSAAAQIGSGELSG